MRERLFVVKPDTEIIVHDVVDYLLLQTVTKFRINALGFPFRNRRRWGSAFFRLMDEVVKVGENVVDSAVYLRRRANGPLTPLWTAWGQIMVEVIELSWVKCIWKLLGIGTILVDWVQGGNRFSVDRVEGGME